MSTEDYLLGTSIEGVLDRHTHTHTHAQSLSLSLFYQHQSCQLYVRQSRREHMKKILHRKATISNFISADSMTVESLEMRRVDILRKREGEREREQASERGRKGGRERESER